MRIAPFDEAPASPNRLRWDPLPLPSEPTDFVDGLVTYGCQRGCKGAAAWPCICMRRTARCGARLLRADGELLIVPQSGALTLRTEFGVIAVAPGEIAVVPRGVRSSVALAEGPRAATSARTTARRSSCPSAGRSARTVSPTTAISSTRSLRTRIAPARSSSSRNSAAACVTTQLEHSPFDVVAWHGNSAPYRYDLARFNVDQHRQLRSSGSVDLHRADVASATRRVSANCRFRDLPAALDGGGAHVPPAVVSTAT